LESALGGVSKMTRQRKNRVCRLTKIADEQAGGGQKGQRDGGECGKELSLRDVLVWGRRRGGATFVKARKGSRATTKIGKEAGKSTRRWGKEGIQRG